MKLKILFILGIIIPILSCNQEKSKKTTHIQSVRYRQDTIADYNKPSDNKTDSSELTLTSNKSIINQNLNDFLESPIDLIKFKKNKGISNSGVYGNNKVYYKPDTTGFYYYYTLFKTPRNLRETERFSGFRIIVYKYGKEAIDYFDTNEILVGINCHFKDPDLGKANLVGLSKKEITDKFGQKYFNKDELLLYQHNKRVLVLKFAENKVEWFKYLRLNKEVPDNNKLPKIFTQF